MKRFLHTTHANFPISSSRGAEGIRRQRKSGRGERGGDGREPTVCLVPSQILNAAEILGTSRALEALTGAFGGRCFGLCATGGLFGWLLDSIGTIGGICISIAIAFGI